LRRFAAEFHSTVEKTVEISSVEGREVRRLFRTLLSPKLRVVLRADEKLTAFLEPMAHYNIVITNLWTAFERAVA
jgi:hypothetical protein